MKVFGCRAQMPYSGGVILVAANSLDEAIKVAAKNDVTAWYFDCIKDRIFVSPDEADIIDSERYPITAWKEFTDLSCNCIEPHVIIEDSHEG